MASKRVLIVDDALDLGRLLQNTLAAFDPSMSVKVVPSAEEAMLEIGKSPLDLLVSDIRLPGINGIDLIRRVRSRNPEMKVIAITALSDENIMDQARSVSDVFLQKPLDIYEFVDHAQRLLGLPRTTQKPPARVVDGVAEPLALTSNRITDTLAGLRGSLGAIAAALLDENGHIVAQAGDLPGGFEEHISPALMASVSAGSAVSGALGMSSVEIVQAFRGKNYSLVCALSHQHVLVVALKTGRNTLRLSIGVEDVLASSRDLAQVLDELGAVKGRIKTSPLTENLAPQSLPGESGSAGAPVPPPGAQPLAQPPPASVGMPPEEIEKGKDVDVKEFESLFQEGSQVGRQAGRQLSPQELDEFWASAQTPGKSMQSPDELNFDQARKLGLAPQDDSPNH